MEWRQQTSFSCADAFTEAQRWIEEVTGKAFGCSDFRAALENGVLLCDLINQLKPGIIKRVNRLSTPIAGLDNVSVFLKACGKLGLNESQLFHPGDLQDLSTRATLRKGESNRRLKNVLITVYWLGRKAHLDAFYSGPQLNFKAFEGLLGLALSKALDDYSNGYRESCYLDREQFQRMSYRRENSVDSVDSLDSRPLHPNSEGCGSDAEAEQVFRMETTQQSDLQTKRHIPSPLLRKKPGREESGWSSSMPFASSDDQPRFISSSPVWAVDEELSLRARYEEDSEDDYTEADPVLDDLYARRVQQTLHQTSINPNCDRFLPRYWTPEEEIRVHTIYLGSQRRPWYRKMQGLRTCQILVRPESQVQVNPGWIWSKSLSDIPMVYPVRKISEGNPVLVEDAGPDDGIAKEANKWKTCGVAKDNEAHWQEDLTKWKNRRRSTKSDLRRKSLDREHVMKQMTNGALTDFDKKETQSGLLKRDQLSPRRHNPAPHPNSTSPPSKSSSSYFQPHARAPLARSYATEASPVGSMPASDGNILVDELHFASSASCGAAVTMPTPDCSFSSLTQVKTQGGSAPLQPPTEPVQLENAFTDQISSLVTKLQNVTEPDSTKEPPAAVSADKELLCIEPKVPTDGGDLAVVDPLVDFSHQKHKSEESQTTSCEPAVERDRGQQAAGSNKYLSRTGSLSCSASLPRGFRRSEGSSRFSSVPAARSFGTKLSRVSSLTRLYHVDDSQGLSLNTEKGGSLSPPAPSPLKRQTATACLRSQDQASSRPKKPNHAKQSGSEQQEKSASFSVQAFQTNKWPHQTHIQNQFVPRPYSNWQSQHSKASALKASIDQPKVDYSDMRVSLTLRPNSRPDFGFQTHWDTTGEKLQFIQPGSPAELCQLRVDDEIVAVDGVAVAHMSLKQREDKMTSALKTGSLTMDIRRYGNKDWSTSRHNQPAQNRMTLNLTAAAPVLIGCPDHHANSNASTETTVTTLSGQTDNIIQVKVLSGELPDSHRTTISKGGSESAISDLQVPSLSPSPSSWSWDHEEDRRRQEKWQEEQERLLQEQYQRDQQRLEAEWQRAQEDATARESNVEMTNGGESPDRGPLLNGSSKTREERSPVRVGDQEEAKPQSDSQREHQDKIPEHDCAEDSCGFAQLSPAHRTKSLSTSALAGPHKQPTGDQKTRKEECVSKAEQERQQILKEMKKRTQLLTDNSWIRQRSSSFYKEPICVGVSLKRYESLDSLEALRRSPLSASSFGFPRPHSAAAGFCAPSRTISPRYSTGSISSQRPASMDLHHNRMVSGRRTCCVCERVLGSEAAMVIEALSLCFHFACFQCVGCQHHLGGAETGVQVRIRNRKPYCEPCYFQLKSNGASPL
ncbi:LIM domain only protein 7-like [Aulostomus maculatus]